jgi:hypothetical protein
MIQHSFSERIIAAALFAGLTRGTFITLLTFHGRERSEQLPVDPVKATVAENHDDILRLQQRHEALDNMSHTWLVKSRPA